MNERKVLAVYNTCGIQCDNTEWYIESINSLLKQDIAGLRVAISSCRNSPECIKKLFSTFGNKISYCLTPELHTVNITFNNTVQKCVDHFGEFDGYMYIDSGCTMDNQTDIIRLAHKTMMDSDYGIVVVQTDTDECLENLGPPYVYQSPNIQVTGDNLVVPIGTSINQHTAIFNNKIFKTYRKLYPDVFAAFCSESVLNYIAASVKTRWAIMANKQIRHLKAVDGPSCGFTHRVESEDKDGKVIKNNHWNNFLFGRNALDFMNDPEAIASGLGFEECSKIMMHDPNAYNEDGFCKNPEKLKNIIDKYMFLSNNELNYDNIKCKFIP
tara:strand:+ start:159 stop:1136 length:978 start_codon:yes stop_codon:yes gene_type:complete